MLAEHNQKNNELPCMHAIIGAGPMGLAAARQLQRHAIPFVGFELHSDVGGLWDIANPHSTMYESAHLISSKGMTQFDEFPMADSVPPKPALVHSDEGAAIALEVYELDMASFGSFTAEVPPPLAIGTVTLADGSSVKGFVAEPRALTGAEDITHLGGWRAYIASR